MVAKMATEENGASFQARLRRIETLIHNLQATANPAVRTSAEELLQVLLELYGVGLARLLDIIWEAGAVGEEIIYERLPQDDLVNNLLLLHGLHPIGIEERVQRALNKVRPYLRSHGGDVELLGVQAGVVQLRLQGSCQSCPASAMTLKYAVEDAIYAAAPDVVEVAAVGVAAPAPTPGFIPLAQLDMAAPSGSAPAGSAHWHEVDDVLALPTRAVHIQPVNGRSLLFCRLDESLYAYGDICPHCRQPLTTARVVGTALTCPHCRQRYDVIRAGRGLDKPDLHLEPFPLLVEAGRVMVALPA